MLPTSSPDHRVIVGHSGILGAALAEAARLCDVAGVSAQLLNSRPVLEGLLRGQNELVRHALECGPKRQDWLLPFGAVNPNAGQDALFSINAKAPAQLFELLSHEASRARKEVQIVTFGSVLEDRPILAGSNPYIESKLQLKSLLRQVSAGAGMGWVHVKLHTLYGGRGPHASMFLGHMEAALRTRAAFRMSSGHQLREYHHASDAALNVLQALTCEHAIGSEIELSTGRAISLRNLAEGVLDTFGMSHLLAIGAVDAPHGEVFDHSYSRSNHIVAEREPIAGVVEWFESLGHVRESGS